MAVLAAAGLMYPICPVLGTSLAASTPIESWQLQEGRFSADLLVTNEHEELIRQWDRLGRHPGQWPRVSVIESARKGEKVHAVVVFRGCLTPDRHPCLMRMDYIVNRPDGSRYGAFLDADLWSDATPAPDPTLVHLAGPYIEFLPETDDPLGTYTTIVRIRSLTRPEGIELRRTLNVISGP